MWGRRSAPTTSTGEAGARHTAVMLATCCAVLPTALTGEAHAPPCCCHACHDAPVAVMAAVDITLLVRWALLLLLEAAWHDCFCQQIRASHARCSVAGTAS